MDHTRRSVVKGIVGGIGLSSIVGTVSGKNIRIIKRDTNFENLNFALWTRSSSAEYYNQIGTTSPDGNDYAYTAIGSGLSYLGTWENDTNTEVIFHDFLFDNTFGGVYIQDAEEEPVNGITTPPDNSSNIERQGVFEHAVGAETTDNLSQTWLVPNVIDKNNYAGATNVSNGGFEKDNIRDALLTTIAEAAGIIKNKIGYALAATAILRSLVNNKSKPNGDEPESLGYGWNSWDRPDSPSNHLRLQWRVPKYGSPSSMKFKSYCEATEENVATLNEMDVGYDPGCGFSTSSFDTDGEVSISSDENLKPPGGGGCVSSLDSSRFDLPEGSHLLGAADGSKFHSDTPMASSDTVIKYYDPQLAINS